LGRGSRRPTTRPAPFAFATHPANHCAVVGIVQLEIFGSVARGESQRGSDVDLLATFGSNPGLHFFTMEDEIAAILGAPVHLLTRDSVEQMTNPYRRQSILADAKLIYHA
jgi:predicted nucleotidyltransferase